MAQQYTKTHIRHNTIKPNTYSKLIRYETGQLSHDDMLTMFQDLIDSGALYELETHYQTTAQTLIDEGYLIP